MQAAIPAGFSEGFNSIAASIALPTRIPSSDAAAAGCHRPIAGVLVDVFYDHFLARDWRRYSPREDLDLFISRTYRTLSNSPVEPPPRLQRALPRMIREDWLGSYATEAGIDLTLKRISRRVSRANPLPDGVSQLKIHYEGLAADFAEFYPAIIRHVADVSESETGSLQEELAL
jgi:acyl carrier protein phosphodiesterase